MLGHSTRLNFSDYFGFAAAFGFGLWWLAFPGDRHNNGANLSFADGHVDHYHWRYRRTIKNYYVGLHTEITHPDDLADHARLHDGVPRTP